MSKACVINSSFFYHFNCNSRPTLLELSIYARKLLVGGCRCCRHFIIYHLYRVLLWFDERSQFNRVCTDDVALYVQIHFEPGFRRYNSVCGRMSRV